MRVLGICLIFGVLVACRRDVQVKADNLQGRWIVQEAYRNEVLTKTLENAYFEFNTESAMSTNLWPDALEISYAIDGNMLLQKSEEVVTYTIQKLTTDSLELSSTIRNYRFYFVMVRDTVGIKIAN